MIIDSPKKSQNKKDTIPKKIGILIIILSVLAFGLFIGGLLGYYGLLYSCVIYDYYNPPTGNGGGLIAVGWIYAFITVPLGSMIGGIISLLIYLKISKK